MNKLINYFKRNPKTLTFISMLVSFFVYSFIFGWIVSLGFTVSLLIHELGHYYAAKRVNISTSVPVFIPFMGAFIDLKEDPHCVEDEAFIGIAGPVAGTLAAMMFFAAFQITGYEPFLVICKLGVFLNLFNLIPLSPMDGGRTITAISPWLWLLGAAILIVAFIIYKSFVILLVGYYGFKQIKFILYDYAYKVGSLPPFYESSAMTKINYGLSYLTLIVILIVMFFTCLNYGA